MFTPVRCETDLGRAKIAEIFAITVDEDTDRDSANPDRSISYPVRDNPRSGRCASAESSTASSASSRKRKEPSRVIYEELGKLLQTLNITMPFTEAFFEVPDNISYLKDALSNEFKFIRDYYEKGYGERENMITPEKSKDPGRFAIMIRLGKKRYKALCDLGASMSLLPLSIWEELKMGELTPTDMEISMADGSCSIPEGIAEDVPVQIDKHFILDDFIVADMIEDENVPVLLGRPFLATVGANINAREGRMTFEIDGAILEFIMEKNYDPS